MRLMGLRVLDSSGGHPGVVRSSVRLIGLVLCIIPLFAGFLPVLVRSRHWLADPRFAAAIAGWCAEERIATASYRDAVLAHSPYVDADPAPAAAR